MRNVYGKGIKKVAKTFNLSDDEYNKIFGGKVIVQGLPKELWEVDCRTIMIRSMPMNCSQQINRPTSQYTPRYTIVHKVYYLAQGILKADTRQQTYPEKAERRLSRSAYLDWESKRSKGGRYTKKACARLYTGEVYYLALGILGGKGVY